jgi:glycosyltransferase involved in cell wall biosynthesis
MEEIQGLVSVSIPFHNRENFLAEAIESVLAQTYTHWELLLVDDGSTDRGAELARGYANRFPRKIRYLEHPNHANVGVTRSRNLGASESRGEYLAFLDSDDVWLPDKLSHQVAVMQAFPQAGLCCGPSEYWYSWDTDAGGKDQVVPLAPPDQLYDPPFLFVKSYPFGNYGAPCPSSYLLRRRAFDLIEGFVQAFNPGTFQLYEDIAFLSKLYLRVPVFVTAVCTDRYRCHPDAMTFRVQGTLREERARRFYFHWLRDHLCSHAVTSPAVWKAFRRKAWMYRLPLPASMTRLLRRAENRLFRWPAS